ncbi:MAG TPA: Vms1/Ankzf1 family peptidyl-tRNA hydrolase [Actinomycetota bacterium]
MATLDQGLLRKLSDWSPAHPVTSLYLDVDGRRHPSRNGYLVRMRDLFKGMSLDGLDREQRRSVAEDMEAIRRHVEDELDRSRVGGVAVFSSSRSGLWESVPVSRPFRDRLHVGSRPLLIPLEGVLERFETFCVLVADREHAKLLYVRQDLVEELKEIHDDVPGRHEQGGWSQARFQRHIEDHVLRHLKHTAQVALRAAQRRPFDHLILAGSEELVAELERELHDYVARKVLDRIVLPITVSAHEVRERVSAIEAELESRRESEALERLTIEARAGTGRAVAGLAGTLEALESGRVETLVVAADLRADGRRCARCGHLSLAEVRCAACGADTEAADHIVEEAVEIAVRQKCRVETIGGAEELAALGGVGALLRF